MPKLSVSYNKTLKLTNVVMTEVPFENFQDIGISIEQLENYIKSKGCRPVGPHIQYMRTQAESGDINDITIKILRQANGYINHTEKPYSMVPELRIKNCLYVRYVGPEENSKFAYDKINLVAFEEGIPLKGDSYTVFLEGANGDVTTDIFMERADA